MWGDLPPHMLDSPRPLRDLVEWRGWVEVTETCEGLFGFPAELVTSGSEIAAIREALTTNQRPT